MRAWCSVSAMPRRSAAQRSRIREGHGTIPTRPSPDPRVGRSPRRARYPLLRHRRTSDRGLTSERRPATAVRHRHRLSGRDPRRLHGRTRATRSSAWMSTRRRSNGCGPARSRSTSPACPNCWPSTSTAAGCASPPSYAEVAEFADVHFVCVGTPQKQGRARRRRELRRGGVQLRWPNTLTRKVLVVGKSTVPAGHGGTHGGAAAGARARHRTSSWPGTRSSCARASPSRTPCARTGWSSACTPTGPSSRSAPRSRRCSRPAPRSSSPTSPPPNWSRSPPTRSWPPRSRSSTRWPRCARSTGADVTQLAEAIGHDARIGRRFLNAGLGFGGGCLPKDIRAFIARAGELGVDQAVSFLHEVDQINLRRRSRTVDIGLDLVDGSYQGTARRRARCRVQAELRRHPRLAGAGRGRLDRAPRRHRRHLRPAGHGATPGECTRN